MYVLNSPHFFKSEYRMKNSFELEQFYEDFLVFIVIGIQNTENFQLVPSLVNTSNSFFKPNS